MRVFEILLIPAVLGNGSSLIFLSQGGREGQRSSGETELSCDSLRKWLSLNSSKSPNSSLESSVIYSSSSICTTGEEGTINSEGLF